MMTMFLLNRVHVQSCLPFCTNAMAGYALSCLFINVIIGISVLSSAEGDGKTGERTHRRRGLSTSEHQRH